MANTLCKIAVVLIVSASVATCKEWRGIVPRMMVLSDAGFRVIRM